MGWRPLVKSWLKAKPVCYTDRMKSIVNSLFERFVDAGLTLVHKCGIKVNICGRLRVKHAYIETNEQLNR